MLRMFHCLLAAKHAHLSTNWRSQVFARCLSDHPLKQRSKDTADVVIVGGGIVGVSTAYHLAKAGVKDVVLLEKSELTSGSTWHAAGLTTFFNPGINARKLHYYSLILYDQLEQETGQHVGLHKPGSIRICSTPQRVDEARYQMSRARWNQAEQYLIGPEEVLKLFPLINVNKVLAGVYNPGDGHIDPYSVTMALAAGARLHGAKIYQHAEVTGMQQNSKGQWLVKTPHGELCSTHVVNATGFWCKDFGKLVNRTFPVISVEHQYVITSSIPEVKQLQQELPVIRDLEGSYYLRQEKQGLLFGPYENMEKMSLCDNWFKNGVPANFGKELFPSNLDRIMLNVEQAMEMVPVLNTAEIQTIVNGPIAYNAENAPLMGPVHGLHNYWMMGGFGYGIIQGGGAGKFLSDWIVNGEPPFDLIELDADRYGWWADESYVLKRARETYALNNLIGFPKEERWEGRPTKRCSPLYADLKANGAEFGFHNGWEQPHWFAKNESEKGYRPSFRRTNWFSAMKREVETVLSNSGIVDITPFSKYVITGFKAAEFLDRLTANNVPKLGSTCITHMITPKGKVYAEITLSHEDVNKFFVLTGSSAELHDLRWIELKIKELGYEDSVKVENVTDKLGALSLAGPNSREILQSVTSVDLSDSNFKFLACKSMKVGKVDCLAIRISYTGELGWEFYCKMADICELYKTLKQAGAAFGTVDFGTYAMNSMRLEKGFAMWGAEMNCDKNPIEAGLEFFTKLNKNADFIGKQALEDIKAAGCGNKLVMLKVAAKDVDAEGNEAIWCNNKVVGNTTSGSYGFQCNHSLAFGYVPTVLAMEGTKLEVELLGDRISAEVLRAPPVLTEPARERQKRVSSVI